MDENLAWYIHKMSPNLVALITLVGAVIAVFLTIVLVFTLMELLRRKREDRGDFQEWVILGAKQKFPELVEAFNEKSGATGNSNVKTEIISLGQLSVPTGRVVVGDPNFFTTNDFEPFDETVPEGRHKVEALLVTAKGQRRIAALRMKWSDAPVEFFQPAWTAESRFRCLEQRFLPAFGVDSACAAIVSREAFEKLHAYPELVESNKLPVPGEDSDPFTVTEGVEGAVGLYREARLAQNGTDLDLDLNIIACYSGVGDGSYHAYFSYDEEQKRTGLYVDFGMLGEPSRIPL